MSATAAYQTKRDEAVALLVKLSMLVDQNDHGNRQTRNWGDVGDMERVLGAVQIAVDVLEVA